MNVPNVQDGIQNVKFFEFQKGAPGRPTPASSGAAGLQPVPPPAPAGGCCCRSNNNSSSSNSNRTRAGMQVEQQHFSPREAARKQQDGSGNCRRKNTVVIASSIIPSKMGLPFYFKCPSYLFTTAPQKGHKDTRGAVFLPPMYGRWMA